MTLKNLKFFLERAAKCERLAEKAKDPRNREMLLFVADRWRSLAAEEERPTIQLGNGEPLSSEKYMLSLMPEDVFFPSC